MVGSSFLLLQRAGRQTLLNAAEIVSAYTEDIDLASNQGTQLYDRFDPALGTLYTIQFLLTSRREMELVYGTAAARDEVYAQLVAALAPSVTIASTEPLPTQLPEVPLPERPHPRYAHPAPAASQEQATPPPAPKPPRKPRTPQK